MGVHCGAVGIPGRALDCRQSRPLGKLRAAFVVGAGDGVDRPEIACINRNYVLYYMLLVERGRNFVEDRFEAGIELFGTEVKSIRAGTLNLKDAYCIAKNGEIYLHGMHVSPYEHGNIFNRDPVRPRRLLMHKREINRLQALAQQDGYALVPLSVYFKNARVKVEVGLCKGKKNYDKRDAIAKRDAKRDIDRAMKSYNR